MLANCPVRQDEARHRLAQRIGSLKVWAFSPSRTFANACLVVLRKRSSSVATVSMLGCISTGEIIRLVFEQLIATWNRTTKDIVSSNNNNTNNNNNDDDDDDDDDEVLMYL